tara:strand:- start:814 stop:981 length:168 start_codon:yes stop_codon:yes gene_type:complete
MEKVIGIISAIVCFAMILYGIIMLFSGEKRPSYSGGGTSGYHADWALMRSTHDGY